MGGAGRLRTDHREGQPAGSIGSTVPTFKPGSDSRRFSALPAILVGFSNGRWTHQPLCLWRP
jgi:hypothetical protein